MISHLSLGTNDLSRAEHFYDALLSHANGEQIFKNDNVIFYGFPDHETKLSITKPYNERDATPGNGTMLALKLVSRQQVDKAYQCAIEMGAECEGKPGERNPGAFYGAYVRDLDGNKIALFHRD